MDKNKFETGLAFLTLSNKYLSLVKNILNETIRQGNLWIIWSDDVLLQKDYDEKTKWSDFIIIIPVLFNFYHGIELLLKGFLALKIDLKPSHKITELFNQFKNNYIENGDIANILTKYIESDNNAMPEILKAILKENNKTINNFHEFLRYPTGQDFLEINNYLKLKYRGDDGVNFFKNLKNDVDVLNEAMVKLYRQIESYNN